LDIQKGGRLEGEEPVVPIRKSDNFKLACGRLLITVRRYEKLGFTESSQNGHIS
jgi:hypothetical protein